MSEFLVNGLNLRANGVAPPLSSEPTCSTGPAPCLSIGRFRVQASWHAPNGSAGFGVPVALTRDAGYFWFFDRNNVELAVKTLNGCGINSRNWFFAAGLTNLDIKITVTDTATGQVNTYSNAQGNPFQPILDTGAFGGCPAASASLSAGNPEEPPAQALLSAPPPGPPAVSSATASGCVEGDTVLCTEGGRFQIEATWQTPSGGSGPGYAVSLTSESGYFWFFEPSNVELIVKTLDACAIGSGEWFFAAGMTDVGVELKVTDTLTGEGKTYSNPVGTPFSPIQDITTFSSCPTSASENSER
jgi:hypothetical protein